ncbi:MAG: PDZ domain-containing protein [Methylacidiphilales bacterium]|nr:PDZ domain-containing protein [Candidatus Methylacidiphilales bacterium]
MLLRLCVFAALIALLAPLRAQDEPIHMRPEFALTFPLAANGDEVTVKYPILINPTTVLKPGMVLRTLYILTSPDDSDGAGTLAIAHQGSMEQAYSRDVPSRSTDVRLPPGLAHELENYRRTVWTVPNNFVLAMAQYPTDIMHLIYSPTGHSQDITDERFIFFDGLMVGSPDGHVTILAVEKESKADNAGLKAGDDILSVGGIPTNDDLRTFANSYASTKKAAFDNEVQSYQMSIRSPGQSPRTVNIPMPPSLKGGLMQGL